MFRTAAHTLRVMGRRRLPLLVLVSVCFGALLLLSRVGPNIGTFVSSRLASEVEVDSSGLALAGSRHRVGVSAQRRTALWSGVLLVAGGAAGPGSVRAESTLNMQRTILIYPEGLQKAADQLVYGIRPRIVQEDWTWLREYLRSDSYGNSKGYVDLGFAIDRVVVGNEDFLEGTENAHLKMLSLLEAANQTAWEESTGRQESLLKSWDDMAALVSGVMTAVEKYVSEEPDLEKVSLYIPFVLPKRDAAQYGRSIEDFDKLVCNGIRESTICIELPEGTTQNIARGAQIGLQVNPFTANSCVDGKCSR